MTGEPPIEALKALGHPLRFRIIQALQPGERNVGEIEDATGIAQPGLSQQLAVLRGAGLVETRRDAKLVYYRIDSASMAALAGALAPFTPAIATDAAPARIPSPGVANFARLTGG